MEARTFKIRAAKQFSLILDVVMMSTPINWVAVRMLLSFVPMRIDLEISDGFCHLAFSRIGSVCPHWHVNSVVLVRDVRTDWWVDTYAQQGGHHSLPCRSETTCGHVGPHFPHPVWTTFLVWTTFFPPYIEIWDHLRYSVGGHPDAQVPL